jgi:putative transposase
MKLNTIRYSSANGEVWAMATFKTKYCHKIFDIAFVRKNCCKLIEEAMQKYNINYKKIGFDEDHVHIMLEMGLLSKPEIAKKIKGYTGKKLLSKFSWLKKKYFWGSGLWNPAYDIRTHDPEIISRYIDKQKYANAGQKTLSAY